MKKKRKKKMMVMVRKMKKKKRKKRKTFQSESAGNKCSACLGALGNKNLFLKFENIHFKNSAKKIRGCSLES